MQSQFLGRWGEKGRNSKCENGIYVSEIGMEIIKAEGKGGEEENMGLAKAE